MGRTTHGLSATRAYRAWKRMKGRCYNKNATGFKYWGGRGIGVCERWRNDFVAFFADMGDCPAGRSLDRVDNDADYSPSNCRWASSHEQNNNKRAVPAGSSGVPGVHRIKDRWQARITINSIKMYFGTFSTVGEAQSAIRAAKLKYGA